MNTNHMDTTTCFDRIASAIKEEAAAINTNGDDEQTSINHIISAKDYVLDSFCTAAIANKLYPAIAYYLRTDNVRDEDKKDVQTAFADLLANAVTEHYNHASATIVTCALAAIQEEHEKAAAAARTSQP